MALYVTLGVIGILLAIPLFLLALPLLVFAHYERKAEVSSSSVSLMPLAGLLGLRLPLRPERRGTELLIAGKRVHTFRRRPAAPSEAGIEKKELPRRPTRKRAKPVAARIASLRHIVSVSRRPALSFVRSLGDAFSIRSLNYNIRFGLSDPASTGQLYGLAQAVVGGVANPRIQGRLDPDFLNTGMQGTLTLAASLRPYRIVAAAVVSALTISLRLAIDYLKHEWPGRRPAARVSASARQTACLSHVHGGPDKRRSGNVN